MVSSVFPSLSTYTVATPTSSMMDSMGIRNEKVTSAKVECGSDGDSNYIM